MRWIAVLVGVALLAAGIVLLREETMSTHVEGRPGSRTAVVIVADTTNAERSSTERELAYALVVTCRLEVVAELTEDVLEEVRPHVYRFALTPALDESDEDQLVGCLEDMRIDHLQLEVVEIDHLSPGEPGGGVATPAAA